jgi:glycogen synthase
MEGYNNTEMSVLMTADAVGGVWTYCMELCRCYSERNVQIHLVTTGAKLQEWQRAEVRALKDIELYESEYLLEWMKDPWRDIDTSGEWLLQLERDIQPDVVHLNSYSYASLPFTAPKIVVAHSDVFSWWKSTRNAVPPPEWNEYYRRVKEGLDNANLIIAPSKAMMKEILHIYQPTAHYKVIYNGRSKEMFSAKEKQPVVFSMGRLWDEAKNVKLLAEASAHINHPVRIAGDSNNHVHEENNVTYLGKLNTAEIAQELATAAVYVLPAKYEPFGLSALEAALSECALVLGDIASLREIWGERALYVNTDDARALAETINQLLADEIKRKEYAEKALQHAQRYSASFFGHEYLNIYHQLLYTHHETRQALA